MKLKTLLTIIIAAASITFASAQDNEIIKQQCEVAAFTAIDAGNGWEVFVKQGDKQSVTIEITERELERAIIEVKNSTLYIYNKPIKRISLWRNRKIVQKAYITVTDLTKISAYGGVDIQFETPLKASDFKLTMSGGSDLKNLSLDCHTFIGTFSGGCDAKITFTAAEEITVNASGGSDIDLYNISASQCSISAGGGCDMTLTGKTENLSIQASGGSDISASHLEAHDCIASFSGAADGKINVTDKLDIKISGASGVSCYGNPTQVEKRVHHSSSLRMR